jgi:signal peptidase I
MVPTAQNSDIVFAENLSGYFYIIQVLGVKLWMKSNT